MPSYFCADPKVTCRANPVPKKAFEPALTLLPSGLWVAFANNQWTAQPIDFTGLAVTVYFYTILPATLNATSCSNTPAGPSHQPTSHKVKDGT